jgi:hypothetical protein
MSDYAQDQGEALKTDDQEKETKRQSRKKVSTVEIKASSRVSVMIKDTHYTMEYTETRSVPKTLNAEELQEQRDLLWDAVNGEVDNQVKDVFKLKK